MPVFSKKRHIINYVQKSNGNVFQEQGVQTWLRPIEPKDNEYYSYAIAFVSVRSIGTPFVYSIKLSDLGLNNPNGYSITVRSLIGPSGVTHAFKECVIGYSKPNTRLKLLHLISHFYSNY